MRRKNINQKQMSDYALQIDVCIFTQWAKKKTADFLFLVVEIKFDKTNIETVLGTSCFVLSIGSTFKLIFYYNYTWGGKFSRI